jgi:hypothetical protein
MYVFSEILGHLIRDDRGYQPAVPSLELSSFLSFLGSTSALARQVLYHLSHASSPPWTFLIIPLS